MPIAESIAGRPERKFLILNKVDLADKAKLLVHAERLNAAVGVRRDLLRLGGDRRRRAPSSRRRSPRAMPEGPWHFPEDQVSDATERALAAEVTREQLYLQLHAELPYASAVETEKFEEREDGSVEIHQQILVERPTQRAIVLGKGGARIKEIGARARAQLAHLLDRPVHLYLHVKVKPSWDEDREVYRDIGLDWVD